jgi:hypothetical protein
VLSTSLAEKRLADLTPVDLEAWLLWALKRRRRTRRRAGPPVESSPVGESKAEAGERQRRRKATLNRVINAI